MRHWTIAILLTLCAAAHAEEGRRYAVLSLIGDQMLIVRRESGTGTNIHRNSRQAVAFEAPVIDRLVLAAADRELRRLDREAQPVLMLPRDPALFALQARQLDEGAAPSDLLPALRGILEPAKATHLVLVTKYRHDALIHVDDGDIGDGRLEGVGFYVDDTVRTRTATTREWVRGVLAPYAYFRVSVIELASGRAIREEPVVAARAFTNESSDSNNVWETLSSARKMEELRNLVAREAERSLAALLAASPSR